MRHGKNAKSAAQLPKPSSDCFEVTQISMRFDQHALAGLMIKPSSLLPMGTAAVAALATGRD